MRRLSYAIVILVCALLTAARGEAGQDKPALVKTKPTAAAASTPVNLNTATASQIETLPGIGPRAAQRIIEYRQKNGGFKKIEEIIENPSSCPYLLRIIDLGDRASVSRSR
jgi:competence ComEA-like helix-hairpin-helix protein